jgi:hypothetical protein
MTHTEVWIFKEAPPDGVSLSILIERSEEPTAKRCVIVLEQPALKEKAAFPITKELFRHIQEGIGSLREIELPDFRRVDSERRPTVIQFRCADKKTGLVIMR